MSNLFSESQLHEFKQALLSKQHELQDSIKQSLYSSALTTELSKIDNHIADQATELYEKERDMGFHAYFLSQLDQTERALSKLENGDYGYCDVCHQPISLERLKAKPDAQFCLQHQPDLNDPKFEQVNDSFVKTNNDERDATFFDGEDTNQQLYQYGTSSLSENQNYNYDFDDEFDDSFQNGVEAIEDFVVTDISGNNVYILRNDAYRHYIAEHDFDVNEQDLNE